MAVGIKAQSVGKALFIEAERLGYSGSDHFNQLIIIPNLPNEYGKKSGHTTIYKRHFSPSYSRNGWDYGNKLPITLGADTLASLDSQEETIELDHYGAPVNRNRWNNETKEVTILNTDEITELADKAGAHANALILGILDSLVSDDSEWNEELLKWDRVGYKLLDENPTIVPIEITDKDMTDLMADSKIPQAVIRRIMNARKRPI
tara:strand:- start:4963 stop:5577 length:615 start_codon:yes stop_codon:yes gene_type:complete